MVKFACYILPEFGATDDSTISVTQIFKILGKDFEALAPEAKALVFAAYFKIAGKIMTKQQEVTQEEQQTLNAIMSAYQLYADNINVELQKRSVEYLTILNTGDLELIAEMSQPMPPFPESSEENNPLLSKMIKLLHKAKQTTSANRENEVKRLIQVQNQIQVA